VVILDERVDKERNVAAGDVSGEDMAIYRPTRAEMAGILGGREWAREEWRQKRAGEKEREKMAGMVGGKKNYREAVPTAWPSAHIVGRCADGLAVGTV
jgi:hypothetical protein